MLIPMATGLLIAGAEEAAVTGHEVSQQVAGENRASQRGCTLYLVVLGCDCNWGFA